MVQAFLCCMVFISALPCRVLKKAQAHGVVGLLVVYDTVNISFSEVLTEFWRKWFISHSFKVLVLLARRNNLDKFTCSVAV